MDGKRCRDCGEEKPLDQFPQQNGGKAGRHPLCKPCRAAQERRRYTRDRERLLEAMRADPERRKRTRRQTLRRKYGMTLHDFETLFVAQRGCCAICEMRPRRLMVDHDHASGVIRGLLCTNCNIGLGQFADEADRCLRAAEYLTSRAAA